MGKSKEKIVYTYFNKISQVCNVTAKNALSLRTNEKFCEKTNEGVPGNVGYFVKRIKV